MEPCQRDILNAHFMIIQTAGIAVTPISVRLLGKTKSALKKKPKSRSKKVERTTTSTDVN
jgi:hypothetical protein